MHRTHGPQNHFVDTRPPQRRINDALANTRALLFAVGCGVNGGLSSRHPSGFLLGFAAAFVVHRAFSHAKAPLATLTRDICSDTLAGYASGGAATARKNLMYGQVTTLLGHLLGWITTRRTALYQDEVYFYESAWWQSRGAISLGNVVVGPLGVSSDGWVKEHELGHRWQALALGALYIPFHVIALALARFVDGTTHGRTNLLENGWHPVPYDRRPAHGWIQRQWQAYRHGAPD